MAARNGVSLLRRSILPLAGRSCRPLSALATAQKHLAPPCRSVTDVRVASRLDAPKACFSTVSDDGLKFGKPELGDAKDMWAIVKNTTLDNNSPYCYLLFATHFKNTSLVCKEGDKTVGFIIAYIVPDQKPDTLFVWQIGVANGMQGRGLGKRMLSTLMNRVIGDGVEHMQATVTKDNVASRKAFQGMAKAHDANFEVSSFFKAEHFPPSVPHDSEDLFTIGPCKPLH
eukprot:CAMPEP_0114556456 /NCGR_PEP_ID=MMETSP0114-20121206/9301_1 /TAXON_ID=31324 /ORGANISM="Goniomonas sp, Strain m" /LENGTH=227 /DNA_ID=CAMNT_0001741667 /DNA_START=6 /DNA_END=689 /DNA_ORIENTATION=+